MISEYITEASIQPLKQVYNLDTSLTTDEEYIITRQGIGMYLNEVSKNATDCKINNNSILTLTEKKYAANMFKLELPSDSVYPMSFITYLVFDHHPSKQWRPKRGYLKDDIPTYDWRNAGFVNIEESTNDASLTRSYTITAVDTFTPNIPVDSGRLKRLGLSSTRLFRIELISERYCRIHHDDGFLKTCLTYPNTDIVDDVCEFRAYISSQSLPEDTQIFEYVIYDSEGYLALSKPLAGGLKTVITHAGTADQNQLWDSVLKGSTDNANPATGWHIKSLIKIQRYVYNDLANVVGHAMDSAWYKYKDGWDDHNTMSIDNTQENIFRKINRRQHYINSYKFLQNNYLIDSQYSTVSGNELSMNITPLKNQLTPEGELAENSPHATGNFGEFCFDYTNFTRKNTDFRTYQKVFNGTNQIAGDDTLHLGYTSYTDKISLKGDQVTYFHLPNSLKPFTWMSVNYRRVPEYPVDPDTGEVDYLYNWQVLPVAVNEARGFNYEDFVGLIRAGAIPGSTPMASDKIFKKRADYRFNSTWGDAGQLGNRDDSQFGTWLCSWLQNAPDDKNEKKYGPVWMDRYYDDSRFSEHQVMGKPANCRSKYLDTLGETKSGYIDVPSELRLERGVLYAYHHIGKNDNKKIIEAFSKLMYHKDLTKYTQQLSGTNTLIPSIEEDGNNIYKFTGSEYGSIEAPTPSHGDFRMSFWMNSDDWTQPMGHQIYGNYTNEGIAIVNDDIITPIVTIPDADRIIITNTDGIPLSTILSTEYTDITADSSSQILISRDAPLGDLMVVSSVDNYSLINTFNINGALIDTHTLSPNVTGGGPYSSKTPIKSISSIRTPAGPGIGGGEYLYTLFSGTSGIGQVDLRTGEYVDITIDMFTTADVLIPGVPGYNGTYKQLDPPLPLFNDRPVYVHWTPGSAERSFIAFSGVYWYLTTNGPDPNPAIEDYIPDGRNFTAPPGPVPTVFNSGLIVGEVDLLYTSQYPQPVYVLPPGGGEYSHIFALDKYIYIISADAMCTSSPEVDGGTNKIYFSSNGSIYTQELVDTDIYEVSGHCIIQGDSTVNINNIKVDNNNNLWVYSTISGNDTISKYNSDNSLVFSKSLSGQVYSSSSRSLTGAKIFDLVREFQPNGKDSQHGLLFHQSADTSGTDVLNISEDGAITFKNTVFPGVGSVNNWSDITDVTSFDAINRLYSTAENSLTFKFRAKNKFNPSDYADISESFNVSKLSPGWHHFCFGFDAKNKGIGYYYIDGVLAKETSIISQDDLGRYGFTNVLGKTSIVGATQSFNNTPLCDYLQQPGYYFSTGFSIKSLRMYNVNLFRSYVKSLSREHAKHLDIEWSIPCGRRSHLDHVDKFHTHHLPGYKANDYNINISSSGISGTDQQKVIEGIITSETQTFQPVPGNIEYTWI